MRWFLLIAAGCMFAACTNTPAKESAIDSTQVNRPVPPPPPSEFADAKYADIGKKQLALMSAGDMDSWLNAFADNAIYRWSSGDSLAGKKAIGDYWKARRTKTVDSIFFTTDIWLPIKVNKPQQDVDAPGVWLLSWYQVHVKYKTGKKLAFFVHADAHFDKNDKIDSYISYVDRAPINKVLGIK